MNFIELEIVTPLGTLQYDSVSYIRCPGSNGSFGILVNHQDGLFSLNIGEIKIKKENSDEYLATSGGFAEIFKGKVKLIVESAEKSSEIDRVRAKNSLNRAQKRTDEKDKNLDVLRNKLSLHRAMNRLKISKR